MATRIHDVHAWCMHGYGCVPFTGTGTSTTHCTSTKLVLFYTCTILYFKVHVHSNIQIIELQSLRGAYYVLDTRPLLAVNSLGLEFVLYFEVRTRPLKNRAFFLK